jgi:hypothetical protein
VESAALATLCRREFVEGFSQHMREKYSALGE